MSDLDTVIAGLRNLAVTVTQAAARTSAGEDLFWQDYDEEEWEDAARYGFDPILSRLVSGCSYVLDYALRWTSVTNSGIWHRCSCDIDRRKTSSQA